MPKLLENVRTDLLTEARRQLCEIGYEKLTMRSIAQSCKIAVGTIYNYFSSKDMLIASLMLDDWLVTLDKMKKACQTSSSIEEAVRSIYEGITEYILSFEKVFSSDTASKDASKLFHQRHVLLRDQIADLLKPFSPLYAGQPDVFLADFTAEALLAWTVEGKPLQEITRVIRKLYCSGETAI